MRAFLLMLTCASLLPAADWNTFPWTERRRRFSRTRTALGNRKGS